MKHSHAYARVEGLDGAAYIKFGLLLNYPNGEPEEIEISTKDTDWTKVKNVGTWFPDAFIGTMSSLQRYASGEETKLTHSVDNAYNTMALVYACLESNAQPGTIVHYQCKFFLKLLYFFQILASYSYKLTNMEE